MGYSLAEVNAKKQGSETRKQTLNRLASNLEKAENVANMEEAKTYGKSLAEINAMRRGKTTRRNVFHKLRKNQIQAILDEYNLSSLTGITPNFFKEVITDTYSSNKHIRDSLNSVGTPRKGTSSSSATASKVASSSSSAASGTVKVSPPTASKVASSSSSAASGTVKVLPPTASKVASSSSSAASGTVKVLPPTGFKMASSAAPVAQTSYMEDFGGAGDCGPLAILGALRNHPSGDLTPKKADGSPMDTLYLRKIVAEHPAFNLEYAKVYQQISDQASDIEKHGPDYFLRLGSGRLESLSDTFSNSLIEFVLRKVPLADFIEYHRNQILIWDTWFGEQDVTLVRLYLATLGITLAPSLSIAVDVEHIDFSNRTITIQNRLGAHFVAILDITRIGHVVQPIRVFGKAVATPFMPITPAASRILEDQVRLVRGAIVPTCQFNTGSKVNYTADPSSSYIVINRRIDPVTMNCNEYDILKISGKTEAATIIDAGRMGSSSTNAFLVNQDSRIVRNVAPAALSAAAPGGGFRRNRSCRNRNTRRNRKTLRKTRRH
jgi:hypothetical protein